MTKETGVETAAAPRRRRWPTVLLALSLTLNLAVIGLIAGAHFRDQSDVRRFPPPDRDMMRSTGFGPFFDAMPREARNRMGEALRGREQQFRPDRAALVEELGTMLSALRADPFDPMVLDAVMSAQQARVNDRIAEGRGVLLEQIATMSPRERAEFADQLEERFSRVLNRGPEGMGDGPRGARDDD